MYKLAHTSTRLNLGDFRNFTGGAFRSRGCSVNPTLKSDQKGEENPKLTGAAILLAGWK